MEEVARKPVATLAQMSVLQGIFDVLIQRQHTLIQHAKVCESCPRCAVFAEAHRKAAEEYQKELHAVFG